MKIVVIGAGSMGKNHARVLFTMGLLAGIVDCRESIAKEVGKKYKVPWATSSDKLEYDAAIVSTPTTTHYEVAKKLIENGKHVLIEKPITTNVDEGYELVDLSKSMGITLAVGHIERFNPMVEYLKNNVKSESIISIGSKRVSGFPPTVKDVGVILDLGIHEIDIQRYLIGEVVEVYANGRRIKHAYEDNASILLFFKTNAIGYIETNWLTPKKIRKIWMTCEDYYIEGDYIDQYVEISFSKLIYDEFNAYNIEIENNTRRINLRKQEPLVREIEDFVNSIENKRAPMVPGEDGVIAVKIARAAIESLEKKKPVEVDK